MEGIFSIQGYFHIADKIVKNLKLKDISNLSKVSKSLATSTARFWFSRFLNKFKLEPQLEELYTNLMAYPNPEIQQSLGYIMRIRVEHGEYVFYNMTHGIQLSLKDKSIYQTNSPFDLSLIFNQGPLVQHIMSQFPNEEKDFPRAVRFALLGNSSPSLLKWLLMKWTEMYPSKKNYMLDFAAECGDPSKFKALLDFGLVPSTNHGIHGQNTKTPMELAVEKGHVEIVKLLLPFHKDNFERPMLMAIWNENQAIIEVLFEHCKVPSSKDMKHLSSKIWKFTNYSWSYYAAIYGKDEALQKLIVLENKSPLPSSRGKQFLYLSEVIQRVSDLDIRYFLCELFHTSSFLLNFIVFCFLVMYLLR